MPPGLQRKSDGKFARQIVSELADMDELPKDLTRYPEVIIEAAEAIKNRREAMVPRNILVCVEPAGKMLTFPRCDERALKLLIDAGTSGVESHDTSELHETPGPPWSAYVHKFRKAGLDIETTRHTLFSGTHARYVLRSAVTVQPAETVPPDQESLGPRVRPAYFKAKRLSGETPGILERVARAASKRFGVSVQPIYVKRIVDDRNGDFRFDG